MPVENPLTALKKASGIGAGPSAAQETGQNWLNAGVEGLRGALSSLVPGVSTPEGTAGGVGSVLGAALPLAAPHPAISALLKMLHVEPEALDAVKLLGNDKVGGFQVPHRTPLQVPEGFSLPEGTSSYPARDPALVDQYALRRDSSALRASDYRTNGSKPTRELKGLPRKAGMQQDVGAEFSSKFSLPAETLGESLPEFTPRGGEGMFNVGRRGAGAATVDPADAAYLALLKRGGR